MALLSILPCASILFLATLGACARERTASTGDANVSVIPSTAPAPSAAPAMSTAPAMSAAPVTSIAPLASAAPAPSPFLVSFGGASRFGSDSLVVANDGAMTSLRQNPGEPEHRKTGRLDRAALTKLERELEQADCCHVSAPARMRVPDEGSTTLSLAFPGQSCVVSLPDKDWSLPAPARCKKVLEQRRATLR